MKKNKNVLIHLKNEKMLKDYIYKIENNIKKHNEVYYLIKKFNSENWGVYLTTIKNFKKGKWKNVYSVNNQTMNTMDINEINEKIDAMIIRNIGSVEGNFKMINKYLDFLISEYKGKIVNNPILMKLGMKKNYLTTINKEKLEQMGMLTIPTKIYDNNITYKEIKKEYKELEKYLIKPLTGELSNSLKCIKDINNIFLKYKKWRVGGWIIQPIKNEIWNGEYQFVFINGKLVNSQKKDYVKDSVLPKQKTRTISKYEPTKKEIEIVSNVINYFERFYNAKIDVCRIDFMKDDKNNPILIEFETVNPSFFIECLNENDEKINYIVDNVFKCCE